MSKVIYKRLSCLYLLKSYIVQVFYLLNEEEGQQNQVYKQ